jgi:carboxylesterase type B
MVCGQAGGQDTKILTDMWIGCPTDQISRNHQAPTYRYLFSYNEYELTNKYQLNQSYHTLELSYVFSNYSGKGFGASLGSIFEQEVTQTDLVLQNAFHDYWISFVMNHQPSAAYSQWPLVSNSQMLEFSANGQPTIRDIKYREAECENIVRMYDSAFGVDHY